MAYGSLADSADNIWSLLCLTGYLAKTKESPAVPGQDAALLRIPNREIHGIFSSFVGERARKSVKGSGLRPLLHHLFDAIWKEDSKAVTELLSSLLSETVSVHDCREAYFQAVLIGLLRSKYAATSGFEAGLGSGAAGRYGIIAEDARHSRAAIIEVQHADSENRMEEMSEKALQQIQEQKYDARVRTQFRTVLHWGIAFHDKSCLAKCSRAR